MGAPREDAALVGGISVSTFHNWMNAGEAINERIQASESVEELNAEEGNYWIFWKNVRESEAQCSYDMHVILYNAAQIDPSRAEWWLSRRRRKDYGRDPTRPIEMTGADGGPMEVSHRAQVHIYIPDNGRDDTSDDDGDDDSEEATADVDNGHADADDD